MKITLPIFQHTDKTLELDDQGLNYSVCDMIIIERVFYHIDNIADYYEGNRAFTIIMSGEQFISSLPRREVENRIDQELNGIRMYVAPN